MSAEHPHLYQFFGAYFHQDWPLDDDTADDVVDRYVRENDRGTVTAAVNELRALLAKDGSDEELAQTLRAFGCEYYPPGDHLGYREWLARVERRLTRQDGA